MQHVTILTAREHEVMRLVIAGYSNRQIAEKLNITTNTVQTHLRNIYRKLAVRNRAAATREYLQ